VFRPSLAKSLHFSSLNPLSTRVEKIEGDFQLKKGGPRHVGGGGSCGKTHLTPTHRKGHRRRRPIILSPASRRAGYTGHNRKRHLWRNLTKIQFPQATNLFARFVSSTLPVHKSNSSARNYSCAQIY
jgi:hypothetical protein